MGARLATSIRAIVPSAAPEANVLPSGLKATLRTRWSWAFSGSARDAGLETSHSTTELSALPEASVAPSGLKATLRTRPVWPRNGSPIEARPATSQRTTALSSYPAASVLPSGLNAILSIPPLSSGKGVADPVATRDLPKDHRPVLATRGECLPVRAERGALYPADVTRESFVHRDRASEVMQDDRAVEGRPTQASCRRG